MAMTPEQKCVSLSTAKRLKEAGFPQDTEKWWDEEDGELYRCVDRSAKDIGCIAAPDSQEIADELPTYFDSGRNTDGQWGCRVYYTKGKAGWYECLGENEQEACAKAWLRLKEDNLI